MALGQTQCTPIDVQQFGWGSHSSIGYYHEGLPLQSTADFRAVIDPLGDYQASQLIQSAAQKDGWGTGLLWGGIALTAAAWIDFGVEMSKIGQFSVSTDQYGDSETNFYEPNLVPFGILLTVGTAAWISGLILYVSGSNDIYNSVNRYNYLLNNAKKLSLFTVPESGRMGLAFTQRF
jgi:hypothetical protein